MKKLIVVFSCFAILGIANAQQANDYFPAQTGFGWNFKVTPLDSLNNPIPSASVFRVDSFASVTNFNGKLANIVPTKYGPLQTILVQPFTDSLFYSPEGTNGFEYFNISRIDEFLIQLDSLQLDPNFSFLDFFTSLQDWYSVYRFAANVNSEYTLILVDTTISTYPLRFEYLAQRLQDETIETVLGNFNCKKFLTEWKVSYLFLPPPFPPIELINTKDSIWIAPDNWVVQDIIPTQHFDLTTVGIGVVTIPGLETKLTDEIVSVKNEEPIASEFILEQNYPNPFNPSTKIKFAVPSNFKSEMSNVSLKVYNVLGNEVAVLVNEEKSEGSYEVEFTGTGLASGIYFYKLQAGSFIETRKMILLK
ncbi:MAG: T9SS type A sorting domain-containing protein [Ignavibacteriales bacterium]